MFSAPSTLPHIFRARIRPRPGGGFTFARDGDMACLVNVPDDLGYFGDCVAWLPGNPSEWWMHEGRLPILGVPEVVFAGDVGCDVFLVETPARYVELARCGRWPGACAVVLDWGTHDSLRLWLSLVRGVQCETSRLARVVEAVLRATPAWRRFRVGFESPMDHRKAA